MNKSLQSRLIAAVVSLLTCACFAESELPSCTTLADCPVGQGFTGCVDGWCYRQDACQDRPVVAGDGCCALTEGDRSADIDCLLLDLQLSCLWPAGPAIDSSGNVFVTCLMVNDDGTRNVVLRRYDTDGNLSVPVVAGTGMVAFEPVIGLGSTVIVQTQDGVARYSTQNLAVAGGQTTPSPVAQIASNRGSPAFRSVAGWPAIDGRVYLFDEERNALFGFGQSRQELGSGGAMRPTMSWTGRRMYVTWNSGLLEVLETGSNPLGHVLSFQLPALAAGPAIDVDGRIYVPLKDGRLVMYRENAQARLLEAWSVSIFGGVGQQRVFLLIRRDNAIVAVSDRGDVQVIRDLDTMGSVVAHGGFDTVLSPVHPVLTESGRVVAVSESGAIVSVLVDDDTGSVVPGLSFNVPSRPASDLVISGGSLMYVSQIGSLMAWSFPDEQDDSRFCGSGSNRGMTGRTSEPTVTQGDQ